MEKKRGHIGIEDAPRPDLHRRHLLETELASDVGLLDRVFPKRRSYSEEGGFLSASHPVLPGGGEYGPLVG
jgi:hypothetical protein